MKQNGDATSVAYTSSSNTNAIEIVSPGESKIGAATLVVEANATEVASPNNRMVTGANTDKMQVASPKRNLPHADLIGYYQFLTFRTHDSIDEYLTRISNENISTSLKQYKADEYLDCSLKGAYLNGKVLVYLSNFLKEKDGELYDLVAFSIMPNHLHILFKQKEEIGKTVKRLKGASSVMINRMLDRKGVFWEKGYFDKAIRDEVHFETVYNYIANNAIKAGLSDARERFYGIYE